MSLQFNQTTIFFNGNPILVESADIDVASDQKPIYVFNKINSIDSYSNAIKGNASFNYLMEPGNEPNYNTISGVLNNNLNYGGTSINIGSNVFTGYLSDYSFELSPGSIVKVKTNFQIYQEITGLISNQTSSIASNGSGVAHYWSAQFISGSSPTAHNLLQASYSASLNLNPIYAIGNSNPTQVIVNSITETLQTVSDLQVNPNFSGKIINFLIPAIQNLKLNNISQNWGYPTSNITIPITGMILDSLKYSVSQDNIILFNNIFKRFY